MFIRFIIYLIAGILIWRVVKSIFSGGRSETIHSAPQDSFEKKDEIDESDIEDAKFKDLE